MSNELMVMISVSSILSVILSIISICLSIYLYVESESAKKSTHKIEWVPVDANGQATKDETEMNKEFEKNMFTDYERDLL
ncbi:MAG: hypothetical protein DRG33_05020 [Deltaproteobacteria bacterium]|nr:MAG: hypothetical protein DRG33_05020 [Deltaproteobacteria bacterium]